MNLNLSAEGDIMQQDKDEIFICCNTFEIDRFNKQAVYAHQVQQVTSLLEEYLRKSLSYHDNLQSLNEQINSTFTFSKSVDFSYYDYIPDQDASYLGKWGRVEIHANFLLFNGIDRVELQRYSDACDLYLSVIDENLRTHSLKISNFRPKHRNAIESLIETIRNRAANQGVKLKFKRAKFKKPERKKKVLNEIKSDPLS